MTSRDTGWVADRHGRGAQSEPAVGVVNAGQEKPIHQAGAREPGA